MERRSYNHPTAQRIPRKGSEMPRGAKGIRYNADYWAEVRKRRQAQHERIMQSKVADHLRFLREDGQAPVYCFFGSAREVQEWSRDFATRLRALNVDFDYRDVVMARPERMRGHHRRLVAVWSSDPVPVSERTRDAEIEALYYIEERNRVWSWEGSVSRETANV
ncbi:hypothetical protein SEA_EUNOIA_30 [Arthrobacter phage Eunoia]|uniref:Uncharacterized protein n=1 Tax=Arthrobacter phage Eunoia TaxID=2499002 RepID=A0A3S9UBQ2_9CAUD|nr:hypothetical protein SEA_EUNOIA_30 [Arthrobacter phage Eunoia]